MFEEIQEWQMQRLGKITSSEVHKLLQSGKKKDEYFGKVALSYIDEKISELITGQPCKELIGLSALEWGNAHESEAIIQLEHKLGIPVEAFGGQNNKFFPLNDFSGGSPDAITEFHLAEIKCPYNPSIHVSNLIASRTKNGNDWMKEHRKEYYAQVQMNMLCTKKGKGLFVSYDPRPLEDNHRLAIIHIEPDYELQETILTRIMKAAEIISDSLYLLSTPPVLIAQHDSEVNATIVESAFDPLLLKKIN